jgi:UDP-glucose 4-epimerase
MYQYSIYKRYLCAGGGSVIGSHACVQILEMTYRLCMHASDSASGSVSIQIRTRTRSFVKKLTTPIVRSENLG